MEIKKLNTAMRQNANHYKYDDVVVGIFDTGIEPLPQFAGRLINGTGVSPVLNDTKGHGTAVASIIDGWLPGCYFVSYRLLPDGTPASFPLFLEACANFAAFARARPNMLCLANMSFNMRLIRADADRFRADIKGMLGAGITSVTAAGNDGGAAPEAYPPSFEEMVCVAAIQDSGQAADFSSILNEVDVCELGVGVEALDTNGQLIHVNGTSFAAPIVLSKIAYLSKLYKNANGKWPTEAQRYQLLIDRCTELGVKGRDPVYGYGWPDLSNVKGSESMLDYIKDTGLTWPGGRVKRTTIDHIQIHHTVGNYGTVSRWEALHKKHIEVKGNRGVPYSYLICDDGTIFLGRGHEYCHGGVTNSKTKNAQGIGANDRSIAIAINGDMQDKTKPTAAQLASLKRLVKDLMQMYNLTPDQVIGHNEVVTYKNGKATGTYATLCPCMDMAAFRASIGSTVICKPPEPDPEPEAEETETEFPRLCEYSGSTYANMRSGPGADNKKIGTFAKGERAIILGVTDSWAEIIKHETTPMQRGFVTKKYVR